MAKCEICGKGTMSGFNVPHSKQRTKRKYSPNVQRRRVVIDGEARRAYICTRCMRTLDKGQ